jgi:hypothetical protein
VFVGERDFRLPEANFIARRRLGAKGDRAPLSNQPAPGNTAEGDFVLPDPDRSAIATAVQADAVDRGTEPDLIDNFHGSPPSFR